MIVQIRGTSGSGKSTVMRQVKEQLGSWVPEYTNGRRKPRYYRRGHLVILGHYESPCGGCDTIGSAAQVFQEIQLLRAKGLRRILCEGLLLSEDVKWSSQLPGLRVVFLDTPLEVCLERIRERRKEAGNKKELNVENTSNRVAVIERARVKLESIGVFCRRCSSEKAPAIILNWLRLHAESGGKNGPGRCLD